MTPALVNFSECDSVKALQDCFDSATIDLVVTSPPYDKLRNYGSDRGGEFDFQGTALELFRVIKPGGVLCWNVADETVAGSESLTSAKQKIFFREQCGFVIHDTMIYEKLNFSHPEKVRYHQMFEYVFILSKGTPKTFNPLMDKKNSTAGCVGNFGTNTFTEKDGSKSVRTKKLTKEFGMRGNVWRGKTRGQEIVCEKLDHPAMMPRWLARDMILSFSNPGDLVADPFCGSGTTGVEAIEAGRRAWLNDKNLEYVAMARAACLTTPGFKI